MHRYGSASIVAGQLHHQAGPICGAVPARDWTIDLSDLHLIAELTTPGGPAFDFFYVFVVGSAPLAYLLPAESLESTGHQAFLGALEDSVGGALYQSLACSLEYRSSVMWPPDLAGQPVIEFATTPLPGPVNRVLGLTRTSFLFGAHASSAVGGTAIVWAA